MKRIAIIAIAAISFTACKSNKDTYDASGTFEAVETIVSAEATGTIKELHVEEGQELKAGTVVGYIDSTQLYLKKKQLEAQVGAVLSKRPNINAQLASLQEQLKHAEKERQRIANLVQGDAATTKQLDDATSQVSVIKKQIEAQQSALGITSSSLSEETLPLDAQIQQLNDQLAKCKIVNEVTGTVLTKYMEASEMATVGKPIYKIANVATITLRAYITGSQLPAVKIGQKIKVLVDDKDGKYKEYTGIVQWISDKAEFTPKTIQTKDERANLVYALKIDVANDGYLKLGMYGEVKF